MTSTVLQLSYVAPYWDCRGMGQKGLMALHLVRVPKIGNQMTKTWKYEDLKGFLRLGARALSLLFLVFIRADSH